MKRIVLCAVALFAESIFPESIYLSCDIIQFTGSEVEKKSDDRLRSILRIITEGKDFAKYKSYQFVAKKNLAVTDEKDVLYTLKNGEIVRLRAISVERAQRKNTVSVEVKVGKTDYGKQSFVDRDYLFLPAGQTNGSKPVDLYVAMRCPVFP